VEFTVLPGVTDGKLTAVREDELGNAVRVEVDDERIARDEAEVEPGRTCLSVAGKSQPGLAPLPGAGRATFAASRSFCRHCAVPFDR